MCLSKGGKQGDLNRNGLNKGQEEKGSSCNGLAVSDSVLRGSHQHLAMHVGEGRPLQITQPSPPESNCEQSVCRTSWAGEGGTSCFAVYFGAFIPQKLRLSELMV